MTLMNSFGFLIVYRNCCGSHSFGIMLACAIAATAPAMMPVRPSTEKIAMRMLRYLPSLLLRSWLPVGGFGFGSSLGFGFSVGF